MDCGLDRECRSIPGAGLLELVERGTFEQLFR